MANLALFDLDHTLLACDSDVQWSQFLYDHGYISQQENVLRERYSQDYHNGTLDLQAFLKFQIGILGQFCLTELEYMHKQFMHDYILPNIHPAAYDLVKGHEKDDCLLVSATNEFIITPIAHHFGITEVIGVSLVKDKQGNYTGEYFGIPSYREGKVMRVEQWLKQYHKSWQDYQSSYFYSDSFNDIPLLRKVDVPIAVNADDKLAAWAKEKNWTMIRI